MKFYFLSFKNLKKILKIKITAILFYQFVLNILYYRLYDLQNDMKVRLYAGDMHLNRKDEKSM